MSSLATSNADEPPRKKTKQPSLSSFASLPQEIVSNILARVPKMYHPILSCVSKNWKNLVSSPEIFKTRSLLGKDSLYLCFFDMSIRPIYDHWFTLRRINNNNTTQDLFDSIDIFFPPEYEYSSSIIAVGPEIFFLPGSYIPSSTFYIFDTRNKEFRQGPNLLVKRSNNNVGLICGKIYVIESNPSDEFGAEVFDLKTQTWTLIPGARGRMWSSDANVSFDRKVCAVTSHLGKSMCSYDTRDASFEKSELPNDKWWKRGMCVINNVLYVYYARFGLMWYDSELKLWRVVYGLDLGKVRSVAMAEYYGKLAFLWKGPGVVDTETKSIWYRMIGLVRSEAGFHGTAEPSQLLTVVPRGYKLQHFFSVAG